MYQPAGSKQETEEKLTRMVDSFVQLVHHPIVLGGELKTHQVCGITEFYLPNVPGYVSFSAGYVEGFDFTGDYYNIHIK